MTGFTGFLYPFQYGHQPFELRFFLSLGKSGVIWPAKPQGIKDQAAAGNMDGFDNSANGRFGMFQRTKHHW
eukprot:scaffold139080_cov62-Attheya_sp.AAC.1